MAVGKPVQPHYWAYCALTVLCATGTAWLVSPTSFTRSVLAFCSLLSGLVGWGLRVRLNTRLSATAQCLGLFLLMLAVTIGRIETQLTYSQLPVQTTVTAYGTLSQVNEATQSAAWHLFAIAHPNDTLMPTNQIVSAYLSPKAFQKVSLQDAQNGQLLAIEIKLKRNPPWRNQPRQLDAARALVTYQGFKGKVLQLDTVSPNSQTHQALMKALPLSLKIRHKVSLWRQRVLAPVKARLALNAPNNAGLLAALVMGDSHQIRPQQKAAFRQTGTSHLMAISGLHVGLLAAFIKVLLSALFKKRSLSLTKQWLTIITITGLYCVLTNAAIPTVRAWLMLSMFGLQVMMGRPLLQWRWYWQSMCLVLCLMPLSIILPGFWLSFAAVGLLLWCGQREDLTHERWRSYGRMQWACFIGLMPLSLMLFGSVALNAPISNAVAIPWMSFVILPVTLIAAILAMTGLGVISEPLWYVSEGSMTALVVVLQKLSNLVPSWTHPINFFAMVILQLLALWHLSSTKQRPRYLSLAAIALCGILPISKPSVFNQTDTPVMTVFEVGQGLAVSICDQGACALIDTGPKDTASRLWPKWYHNQSNVVESVYLSHGDSDHAGGWHRFFARLNSPPTLKTNACEGGPQTRLNQGDSLQLGRFQITALWPSVSECQSIPKGRNDQSLVLKICANGQCALLPGDISMRTEKRLLATYPKSVLQSEALVVAHHGSQSSSHTAFLEAVNPTIAIVSRGIDNPYHHPHPKVMARLQGLGIPVKDTAVEGAIALAFNEESLRVTPVYQPLPFESLWSANL